MQKDQINVWGYDDEQKFKMDSKSTLQAFLCR